MATITGYPNGFPGGVTRTHGDADGVVNVDIGLGGGVFASNGIIISTGLTKHPTAYHIYANTALAGLDQGVGSAVETILRVLQTASTVVMYQVQAANGSFGNLDVLVEAQGFGSDANVLTALGGNISTAANVATPIVSVSSSLGFKLASS